MDRGAWQATVQDLTTKKGTMTLSKLVSLYFTKEKNEILLEYVVHHASARSCLTLCDSMDCSLPGSSVHGIFQARILEWVANSFSRNLRGTVILFAATLKMGKLTLKYLLSPAQGLIAVK